MRKNKNSKQRMILFGLIALIQVSVIINVKPSKYTETITNIFLEGKATEVFMKLDILIY